MTTHEKHPSIIALSAKKQVQQFKQLFENYSQSNESNIHDDTSNQQPQNEYITYYTPRDKRKNESIEIIIDHSSDNRSISTWLEISDDDYFNNDTELTNNDIITNPINHSETESDNSNELNENEILEISATLTLSPSYGTIDNIISIQQSITSPIKSNYSTKPFTFEQEQFIFENNKKQIKQKPIINELILQNKTYKKEPSQSLIFLKNKKLVNNGLKCFDENKENDNECIIDDVDRPLPIWLANKCKKDINNKLDNKECNHIRELTDVLD